MQRGKCYTVWVPPCSLKSPGSSYHSFVISGATCAENRRGKEKKSLVTLREGIVTFSLPTR